MSQYLLSVITICRNDLMGLKKTISSYPLSLSNIEYLIIDGRSSDGSFEYLDALTIEGLHWISELDNGIYDAMNKGLKLSKGKYVIFMNSGDRFHDQQNFSILLNTLKESEPDILYGDTMMVDTNYKELGLRSIITTRNLPDSLTSSSMKKGMLVCHQSFIVKKEISSNYIGNNLSADIDWQIKALKKAAHIVKHNGIIAQYLTGGTSEQNHFRSLIDRFVVMKSHYGLCETIYSHCYFIYRAFIFRLSRKRENS